MSVENFDYENLAISMRINIKSILPNDLPSSKEEYILNLLEEYVKLSGEALCEDDDYIYSSEDAEFICVNTVNSCAKKFIECKEREFTEEEWSLIMQRIAFTVFEILRIAVKNNVNKEDIKNALESHVEKAFWDQILELKNNTFSDIEKTQKNETYSEYANTLESIYNDEGKSFENNHADFKFSFTELFKYSDIKILKYFINLNHNFVELCRKIVNGCINYSGVILTCSICVGYAYWIYLAIPKPLSVINVLSFIKSNIIFAVLYTILIIAACYFYYKKFHMQLTAQELIQLEDVKARMEYYKWKNSPEGMYANLDTDIVNIIYGDALVPIFDEDYPSDESWIDIEASLRKRLTEELGYIIPYVKVEYSNELENCEYKILIREVEATSGYVYCNYNMVTAEDWDANYKTIPEDAIVGVNPINQEQVYWILPHENYKKISVKSAIEVIVSHLHQSLIKQADKILTISTVKKMVDFVNEKEPQTVIEFYKTGLTNVDLQKILVNLVTEEVSIKDITFILERLSDYARYSKEADRLSEYLRFALNRQICVKNSDCCKILYALTLSPEWENTLEECLHKENNETTLIIDPELLNALSQGIQSARRGVMQTYKVIPVILCSPRIRLPLYRKLKDGFPFITVISYAELITDIQVETVETIEFVS